MSNQLACSLSELLHPFSEAQHNHSRAPEGLHGTLVCHPWKAQQGMHTRRVIWALQGDCFPKHDVCCLHDLCLQHIEMNEASISLTRLCTEPMSLAGILDIMYRPCEDNASRCALAPSLQSVTPALLARGLCRSPVVDRAAVRPPRPPQGRLHLPSPAQSPPLCALQLPSAQPCGQHLCPALPCATRVPLHTRAPVQC